MQQAAASSGGETAGLDNYDPFNKQKTTTTAAPAGEQPAVMSPTQETPPPAYNQSAQQSVTAADFQVRDEQVDIVDSKTVVFSSSQELQVSKTLNTSVLENVYTRI